MMAMQAFKKDTTQVENSGSEQTVGERLRKARTKRGEKLPQISDILRISERYLKAIEEYDLPALPEAVYTLGFVKTYAHYLGLDVDEVVANFKSDLSTKPKASILDFPVSVPNKGVPSLSVVAIAAIIAGLVVALWKFLRG